MLAGNQQEMQVWRKQTSSFLQSSQVLLVSTMFFLAKALTASKRLKSDDVQDSSFTCFTHVPHICLHACQELGVETAGAWRQNHAAQSPSIKQVRISPN
eukprot:1159499-Pelagomonas_calceolata.AAC.2